MKPASPSFLVRSHKRAGNGVRATVNGFTLIEIVIVLTIVAVLAAASVPTFRGLVNERKAREPVAELARLAKLARMKAMKEKRPYQVAISGQGFTASRYFDPYLTQAELTDFLSLSDQAESAGEPKEDDADDPLAKPADPSSAGKVSENTTQLTGQAPVPKAEWNERYTLQPGTIVAPQFWHESVPTQLGAEDLRLWVFQPSGLCEPIKVDIMRENVKLHVEFNALTADIIREINDVK